MSIVAYIANIGAVKTCTNPHCASVEEELFFGQHDTGGIEEQFVPCTKCENYAWDNEDDEHATYWCGVFEDAINPDDDSEGCWHKVCIKCGKRNPQGRG